MTAEKIHLMLRCILSVKSRKVEESPYGHIGIKGALMFPEIQYILDHKGYIILHAHIDCILQCSNLRLQLQHSDCIFFTAGVCLL